MENKIPDRLKEYNEKVKKGEIERTPPKDPIQKAKDNPKSLRAALNAKCWECACYQRKEVTECTAKDCPLWRLRPWQRK